MHSFNEEGKKPYPPPIKYFILKINNDYPDNLELKHYYIEAMGYVTRLRENALNPADRYFLQLRSSTLHTPVGKTLLASYEEEAISYVNQIVGTQAEKSIPQPTPLPLASNVKNRFHFWNKNVYQITGLVAAGIAIGTALCSITYR